MFQRLRAISLTASFLLLGFGTAYAQLSGTYTIDPSGSGTSNYTTITSAISALTTSGVNGATVFNIKQGTYTEQLTFSAIIGTSNANGVTFQSDPTNTSSPVITFAPTSSSTTSNYTVQFNGATHVTLDGLNITSSGTSYGRVLSFYGSSSSNITLSNNTIDGVGTSTSSNYAVLYGSGANVDTLHITDNTFTGGSYLTYFYGSSSNMAEDFKFNNNTATGFKSYGVYTYYVNSGEIVGNTLTQDPTSTSYFYAIRTRNIIANSTVAPGTWLIHDNHLTGGRGYGLYLYYTGGSSTAPTKVYNNMVHFNGGTTSSSYGAYVYHPVNVEIYNNTTRNNGTSNFNRGIYTSATTSTSYPTPSATIKNNIFVNDVAGYPAYFYVSSAFTTSYLTLGNNIYYTPAAGNQGFYYGTAALSSFAAYQAASGDTTSYASDPIFLGASDLHVEGLLADGNASVVSYITSDIDGDTRSSTTPDIGADEFVPPLCATPSGLTIGVTTPSNTSMTWMGNSSQYDLEWGPTGFTQGTGTSTTVATNAATISTSAATIYDIYVRSNCSSAGQGYSNWSGPYTFTTPCLVQSLPVTEGFSTWIPTCWSVDEGSSPWLPYTAAAPTMAEANFWSVNDASYSLQSPIIALTANAQIKYAYSHSGQYATNYPYDSLSIRIRDVNSTTWTTLHTHNAANGNFATTGAVGVGAPSATLDQGIVMIPTSFTGDSVIVEFYAWSDWGPDLFLDNLVIEAQPACPPPTGVSVFAVTSSTAMVAFAPSTGNTSFTVEWGPCGYTPGTGASTTGTNDTILVTGLSSQTCYDFYVYGTCGTVSSPTGGGPATATTSCNAQLVPYTEGFENSPWVANTGFTYNADVFSSCWSRTPDQYTQFAWLVRTGSTPSSSTGPSGAATGSNYLYTEGSYGIAGNIAEIRLPQFYKTVAGAFEVSFAYHTYGQTMDSTFVEYSNDMGITWQMMGGVAQSQTSSTDPWETFTAYPAATGDTLDVRIRHRKGSSFYSDMGIDDISVNVVTCPTPAVTVDSVSSTSVSISWSNALGTNPLGSNIMWGPQGFYQGTTASGINIYGVTSPYTITGLNPNTFYDFYVTDSCGATDFSGLAGPATAKTECVSTLSGAYTIDTAGTGANNFTTLDSAVQFLSGCGVSGPVTFTLAANQTWVTGISLTSVIGASSTNTVTFQGQTGSKVMAALGMNEAVLLNGTKYVTLKDMIIDGNGFTAIRLTNNAQYINIEDNLVVADTVGTTSSVTAITATSSMTSGTAYGNNANHITISGNEIKGGYYGIVMSGSSFSSRISDINILNNDLTLQYFYGIRCYYVEDVDIIGNSFTDARASGSYGIYAGYCFDFNIEENNLVAKTYALYLYYANYQANGLSTQSRVVNNMAASGGAYGMYAYTPRFVDFYNNTFKGSTYGAYLYSTTSTTLKSKMWNVQNNIFVGVSNYAVYVPNIPDSIIGWDYNLYNTGGANLARWGTTNYATLAAWQTANTAYNQNSSDAAVLFASSDDLHVVNGGPNNIATPIASVTVDVDGDSRSTTTPDIGADEFAPISDDAAIVKIAGIGSCGDSAVTVDVIVYNNGLSPITSLSVNVSFTDVAAATTVSQQTTSTVTIPAFTHDTVQVGTFVTYAGGDFDVDGYVVLANDQDGSNDSLSNTTTSIISYEPVVVTGDTVCSSVDSTMLSASPVAGVLYGWYANATDTTTLAEGDDYTVSTAGQSTYYVGYLSSTDTSAIGSGTLTTGTNTRITPYKTYYMDGRAQYIVTAAEMAAMTGGYGASQISAIGFDVAATNSAPMANFAIKAGNVASIPATGFITSTSFTSVYTNTSLAPTTGWNMHYFTTNFMWDGASNVVFEVCFDNSAWTGNYSVYYHTAAHTATIDGYTDASSASGCTPGVITNAIGTTSRPNMKMVGTSTSCSNLRKPVSFFLNSDTALAVGSGTETVPASGTYDFDATGSYGQTYDWTYGDGNVGSGLMVQHSYPTAGVYTVSLVVMDTVCGSSDSVSFQVTSHVGLDENVLGQLIQAYPNPSNGQLMITIDGMNDFEGLLQVVNGVGQVLVQETVAKQSGLVSIPMDLRDLAKGVYTIRLAGEAGENNLRVVLQ